MRSRDPADERAIADALLDRVLRDAWVNPAEAPALARLITGFDCPVSPGLIAGMLAARLADRVGHVVADGWTPSDLAHLVRRRSGERHLGHLAGLLSAELGRHLADRVHPAWLHEVDGLGFARRLDLEGVEGLAAALVVGGALAGLPPIAEVLPPPGRRMQPAVHPVGPADPQRLAKVRALLAKAESTEFPDEAEALSAKAQELISRYALQRLVDEPRADVRARRLWLDPPYVLAKAMLVDAVARANRCRTAVHESLGYVTIVGDPEDLEAVELVTTSLLVQAVTAMLAPGTAERGRAASFRRAFLMSYAARIGERLANVTDEAAQSSPRRDALVPALRRRSEQVDAAFDATFPRIRSRRTSYSNGDGWDAGRAAADQANLAPWQRLTGS